MSGVEVVGLLLGVFPLLISALEHYRQGAEILEDWWQIKKEYKKCKNEIKVHELAFESNMERFLLPLIVDDDDVDTLMAEPGGPAWTDPALEETLKRRLPKSYDLFLDTVSYIKDTMDSLKDELGVERYAFEAASLTKASGSESQKNKPMEKSLNPFKKLLSKFESTSLDLTIQNTNDREKWLSRPNFQFQTQRVKFTFGKNSRAKLFDELTRYNGRLRDLLDTNDKSQSLRQAREYIRETPIKKVVCKLWRHTSALHRLLEQAWCCQCKHLHQISLLLRQDITIEDIEFYIRISYASAHFKIASPWNWKDMKAQHIDPELDHPKAIPAVSQELKSPSSVRKTALRPALRQSDTQKPASRVKVNWAATVYPTDASSLPQAQDKSIISDLCSTLSISSPGESCLGLLKDNEAWYTLHVGNYQIEGVQSNDTVSLAQLLSRASETKLDRRQRYTVAFTLASSHLQFYPSPWLDTQWTKKNVVFNKVPTQAQMIDIERPYIQKDTSSSEKLPSLAYASTDRSLSTLGILLIELCFGIALEEHEMRRQYESSTMQGISNPDLVAALDLAVALEWSRSVNGEAGDQYADAVQWCLRGQVGDVESDEWREELCYNVVKPLQFCYEQMYPRK